MLLLLYVLLGQALNETVLHTLTVAVALQLPEAVVMGLPLREWVLLLLCVLLGQALNEAVEQALGLGEEDRHTVGVPLPCSVRLGESVPEEQVLKDWVREEDSVRDTVLEVEGEDVALPGREVRALGEGELLASEWGKPDSKRIDQRTAGIRPQVTQSPNKKRKGFVF